MKLLSMRNQVLVAIAAILISSLASSQINLQWEVRYNHPTANFIDKAVEIELDGAGNTYVVGTSFNGANYDITTIKYNSSGVEQWVNIYNGPGNGLDEASGIAIDASNDVFITGAAFNGGSDWDIVTRKISGATGVTSWTHVNAGTANYDTGKDIVVDNVGRVVVVGYVSTGVTNQDIITMSFPNAGAVPTWSAILDNGFSATDNDQARVVVVDGSNNIYVGGQAENNSTTTYFDFWTVKYAPGGGAPLFSTQHDSGSGNLDAPHAICLDGAGNVILAGQAFTDNTNEDDYFAQKVNGTTGASIWKRLYAGDGDGLDKITAVTADAASNVYITGQSKSAATSEDFYTRKYNSGGTVQWSHRFTSTGLNFDSGSDLELSASGLYLYVTGYSYEAGDNNDYTTVKYDVASGNVEWYIEFNGPASLSDQALKMELDATENIYVTGVSHGGALLNLDYSTIKYCQLEAFASNDTSICIGESVDLTVTGGTNETWTVLSGDFASLSCSICATTTATPSVTSVYTASIASLSGCIDYDTVTVTVNPLPTPTVYNDTPLDFCVGGSVTLYTDTYVTYLWTPGGSTTISQVCSAPGLYTVDITDTNGCQASASATVTNYTLPPVDAGPQDSVCIGSSIDLLATGALDYLWDVNPTLSLLTIPNPTATPAVSTWYYVTGEDINDCANTDSVFIFVNSLPAVSAGPDGGSVCLGDGIPLLATGADTYLWTFHPTLSSPLDVPDPTATPTTITEYFVTGTDVNGCTDVDSVTISTINLPNIMILGDVDTAHCIGDSVQLVATGGLSSLYVWDPSPDLSSLTIANPWASPSTTMTFEVEGTDINGCSNTDDILVTVYDLPSISAGPDDSHCIGDSSQLNASGGVSYLWTFHPTLSEIDIPDPWAKPTITPFNYTVTGTDANGCSNTDVVTISIDPLPTIDIIGDTEICIGDSTQLFGVGGITFIWTFDFTLSSIIVPDPWADPVSDHWYYVTGYDANSCQGNDSIEVFVHPLPPIPTITQDGVFLISSEPNGNQWYHEAGGGTLIPGPNGTNDSLNYYLYGMNGQYWVVYTDSNGCSSMNDTILNNIIVVDVGLDEVEAFGANVYPNPSSGVLFIELDKEAEKLIMFDGSGKMILQKSNVQAGKNEFDLSELPVGMYMIQLIRSDQMLSVKLIIQ